MGSLSDVRIEQSLGDNEALQRSETHAAPKALSRLQLMLRRWRTRRALLQLGDHELRDVGLSWQEARSEGCKPFWKP
ncbi:DUF1127 domain-containing protein [Pseudomonas fulva]|uniref:DUF1127 domain-containing protein n=1 Tax=Pseudomonas fulva TaxID=47880 RepID=UPI0018AC7060|nr:DUF1127 domain-containing protein [Pseudomonas fulva]MBF8673089.1 DUF1127 domain-containing protein [Pseudomonas fulva]MBF8695520.1 DUF1127 domain-containing protein [Pseudomonas fulva]